MVSDEWRAFRSALLWMFEAALPFEHRPAIKAVLCQLAENLAEIDLAIA